MISFLEGKIEYLGDKFAILNAGGIGYKVTMVPKLMIILSKNQASVNGQEPEKIKLFIHSQLNIRDGTFDLYGFNDSGDLELFNTILSVNGIGPKSAMNILATVEPKHLKAAIVNDDADYLRKVSGLGPKVAQRLVLELKNKVDYIDLGDMVGVDLGQEHQAVEALVSLGYSQSVAKETLKEVKAGTLQQRVTEALKMLGKK